MHISSAKDKGAKFHSPSVCVPSPGKHTNMLQQRNREECCRINAYITGPFLLAHSVFRIYKEGIWILCALYFSTMDLCYLGDPGWQYTQTKTASSPHSPKLVINDIPWVRSVSLEVLTILVNIYPLISIRAGMPVMLTPSVMSNFKQKRVSPYSPDPRPRCLGLAYRRGRRGPCR